ncbi:hypothetical protein [Agrobacterium larrymoorei]|uniref:hypothetical protein n=1 Tax=Agrobacterium larrymoorei TaxID=160699 RepID=UPI0030BE3C07
MSSALRYVADIWISLLAAVLVAVGAFLSMGLLGLLVYHLVSPVLAFRYPPLASWDQSLVWPLIIVMPVLWAPSFIIAGIANRHMRLRGSRPLTHGFLYIGILFVSAVLAWWVLLNANPTVWQ